MKIVKILALVLALSMVLCGCAEAKGSEDETKAEEQAAEPGVMTEAELTAALQTEARVTIGADLTLTQEVLVNGKILNGGGFTLTGPVSQDGVVETENGITVAGGTVENVTIIGKYRAIGDRKGMGANQDVRLKNITVDGGNAYALNFGYGSGSASLFVDDSTLLGWSSYTKFQQAIFTNCTFGWSADGSSGNLRPYINTTLTGCHFEGKTEADGTVTPFNLSFKSGTDGILLVVRQNYCDRNVLADTVHQFAFIQAKTLGVVFNCTNEHIGNGYYKKYYKRYYKGYGRGYENTGRKIVEQGDKEN